MRCWAALLVCQVLVGSSGDGLTRKLRQPSSSSSVPHWPTLPTLPTLAHTDQHYYWQHRLS